jgi:predicted nucleic acid-binding protein
MISAVDTNILLDVLIPEARAMETSQQLLDASLRQGSLVIGEVVYAELVEYTVDLIVVTEAQLTKAARPMEKIVKAGARRKSVWKLTRRLRLSSILGQRKP